MHLPKLQYAATCCTLAELYVYVALALYPQMSAAVHLSPEADAAINTLLRRLQSQLPGLHPMMAAAEEQPGRLSAAQHAKGEVSQLFAV